LCLLALTRFEQITFVLCAIPFSLLAYRACGFPTGRSLAKTAWMTGALALFSLPWVIRNMVRFGAPFASNNAQSVTLVYSGISPTSFWPPDAAPATLFTEPGLWLFDRLGYASRNWATVVQVTDSLIYVVPLLALVVWGRLGRAQKVAILLCAVHGAVSFLSISLTPYHDSRYWIPLHLNLVLVATIAVVAVLKAVSLGRAMTVLLGVLLAGFLASGFATPAFRRVLGDRFLKGAFVVPRLKEQARDHRKLMAHYRRFLRPDAIISPCRYGEMFTYFTGRRTVEYPLNLWNSKSVRDDRAFYLWLEKWKIDYLLVWKEHEAPFLDFYEKPYVVRRRAGDVLLDARRILADFAPVDGPPS
ncbi:MAG: hypothetical protein PHU25_21300, partial [Deltaproteobacteria bacterium]|nr:hypothetical protein [Deltaproteobacteria bacterium]